MTKISYKSKDGRLAGVATFYELKVGDTYFDSQLDYWGKPYMQHTLSDKDKEKIDKKVAQFNRIIKKL